MRFYEGPSKDGLYSLPTLVFASPVTLLVPFPADVPCSYVHTHRCPSRRARVCTGTVSRIGRNAGIIAGEI